MHKTPMCQWINVLEVWTVKPTKLLTHHTAGQKNKIKKSIKREWNGFLTCNPLCLYCSHSCWHKVSWFVPWAQKYGKSGSINCICPLQTALPAFQLTVAKNSFMEWGEFALFYSRWWVNKFTWVLLEVFFLFLLFCCLFFLTGKKL